MEASKISNFQLISSKKKKFTDHFVQRSKYSKLTLFVKKGSHQAYIQIYVIHVLYIRICFQKERG